MGYVGQHLVSVVTGYHGGKSGARGHDLVIDNGNYGEIKTCYRVDQLGCCRQCKAVVSSLENKCSACNSINIDRKDDSKWLINLRNDTEFSKVIEPTKYYFVLFEFANLADPTNTDIEATIWEVNPLKKGFSFCMIDYYLNMRTNSPSKAAFNMWPHDFKFALTQPVLIYKSLIKSNGNIDTQIFPSMNNSFLDELRPLMEYSRATTITVEVARKVLEKITGINACDFLKKDCLLKLEAIKFNKQITNEQLCDIFSEEIYLPKILPLKDKIPTSIKKHFSQ